MRVCDLPLEAVKVGLRVHSLVNQAKLGTVVKVDPGDDNFAWVQWDNDNQPLSGFYGTDCECEVAEASAPPVSRR